MLVSRFVATAALILALFIGSSGSGRAASFILLDLYEASSSTGNIALLSRLGEEPLAPTARFVSTPDNDTFSNSLSSGVLRGVVTCSNILICGPSGSSGYFNRRAPTGSTVISAVTFVADFGTPLAMYFGNQTFLVVIGNGSSYRSIYDSFGSVSTSANATAADIAAQLDSYFATVSSVSAATETEGTALVHTVTLSRPSLGTEVLAFSRTNTTTADADIGAISFSNGVTLNGNSLYLPSGISSFTVTVPSVDDSDIESAESYALLVGGVTATGTINDNDSNVTVSAVGSASALEGSDLAHAVTLSGPTSNVTTLAFSLADVTSTAADYGAPSFSDGVTLSGGTLSVPAGVASFTVTIAAADDAEIEATESYTLTIGGIAATGAISDSDIAAFHAVKTASLSDLDGIAGPSAGDQVTWTITVHNDGTVPLSGLRVISDDMIRAGGGAISGFGASDFGAAGVATLAVGGSTTMSATYTLNQADIDAGGLINTATIGATPTGGSELTDVTEDGDLTDGNTTDDVTELTLSATGGLALIKSATLNDDDGTPGVSAGDSIDYSFTLVNTGSVTLTHLTVSDPMVSVSGALASLAPGASDSTGFTASYTLTQADIDAGGVTNQATASGALPGGGTVSDTSGTASDNDDATETPLSAMGGLALIKSATLNDDDGTPGVSAGDSIDYRFTLMNTGSVTLSNLTVSDPLVSVSGALASLAPGASDSTSFTATYTLTQADIDAGGVTNQATASGALPGGGTVSDTSGTASDNDDATETPLSATGGLALIKSATLNDDDGTPGVSAGDSIDYSFTLVNTGSVTLSNLTVSDPMVTVSGSLASLAPGASDSTSFMASYTLTQADIDAGGVTNQATASGALPGGGTVSDTSGTASDNDDATETPLSATGGLALIKSATLNDDDGTPGVSAGDSIDYSFTLVNTGSVTLTNLTVSDPMVSVSGALASLAPGASNSTSFTASYTITAADVLAGAVTNQATGIGILGVGRTVNDLSGTAQDNDIATVTFLGSIAGSVADMRGARAGSIVTLLEANSRIVLASSSTDSRGRYSFIGLEPGSFCIRFDHGEDEAVISTPGDSVRGETQGDQVCGIDIVLGANRTVSGVDAVMVDPSGVVYDAVSRSPITGATVTLLINGSPVPDAWLAASGNLNNHVTGADGLYSFLLQSPAISGTYTLQVTAPGYETSTLLPAHQTALTPGTGLGVQQIVPFATAPAAGQDTTHYLAFAMNFPDWTNAASLSMGVVHNHIPLDPTGVATALVLTKTADTTGLNTPARVGDVIRYTITAQNTGPLAVSGLSLDDPLTADEALVAETGVTTDGILDPGETWTWTATVTLDGTSVNLDRIENLATLTATDAWGAPLVLESRPGGNDILGAGHGQPTVVELAGLIDEIRDDLQAILEDDLRETLYRLGHSFSGYARGAAQRLRNGAPSGCESEDVAQTDLSLHADDTGIEASGNSYREAWDCIRQEWRIDTVEVSSSQTELSGNQTMVSYTHRAERLIGADRLRGRFWGGYLSRTDIQRSDAEGRIDGIGVYGGIYGARRLGAEGMLDYYLAGAIGRHSFTFDFPRAVTITADGSYTYAAVFAGAALSRPFQAGALAIAPRLGFDLAYAPGARVSLTATQGAREQAGSFRMDRVGTWRTFAEVEFRHEVSEGDSPALSSFGITPSVLCEGALGIETSCGVGLLIDATMLSRDGQAIWTAELDASHTSLRETIALRLSYERHLRGIDGVMRLGVSAADTGALQASASMMMEF
ncbi:DUF11 domain-containing protein [Pararhodobacter sp. CCB-MM2]|uniref:beta strand repeat-containing protein n=1 Tax=Pararhodobacter sp. CCB-MM2 TaxID=1786003 RepID=UPI001314A468|nr:DUF11 domain-containing protein [Pararhodobacter sp. CCB-MM2]